MAGGRNWMIFNVLSLRVFHSMFSILTHFYVLQTYQGSKINSGWATKNIPLCFHTSAIICTVPVACPNITNHLEKVTKWIHTIYQKQSAMISLDFETASLSLGGAFLSQKWLKALFWMFRKEVTLSCCPLCPIRYVLPNVRNRARGLTAVFLLWSCIKQ